MKSETTDLETLASLVSSRRQFLFVCAGVVPAVFAGEQRVLALSRATILKLGRVCSFCGMSAYNVFALAGVPARPHRICDRCLELFVITMEQRGIEREPGGPRVPAPNAVEGDFGALLRWLRAARVHRDEIVARGRPCSANVACSFCDTDKSDCASFIGLPNVFVCDRCVLNGIDMLTRSGWQPSGRGLSPRSKNRAT